MNALSLSDREIARSTFVARKPRLWFDRWQCLLWGPLFRAEMTFDQAQIFLSDLEIDGMIGWRLPHYWEIARLRDCLCRNDGPWPLMPYIPKRHGWILTATHVHEGYKRKRKPALEKLRWITPIKNGRGRFGEGLTGQIFPVRALEATVVRGYRTAKLEDCR